MRAAVARSCGSWQARRDAPTALALELADLPADEGEHGRVELRAIRDLRNINCLAPEHSAWSPDSTSSSGTTARVRAAYGD